MSGLANNSYLTVSIQLNPEQFQPALSLYKVIFPLIVIGYD